MAVYGMNHVPVYKSTLNGTCRLRITIETSAPVIHAVIVNNDGVYGVSSPEEKFVDFDVPRAGTYYTLMYPDDAGNAIPITTLT